MKICSRCQQPEGEVRFNWKNRMLDIKHSKCVDCTVTYNRERYQRVKKTEVKKINKRRKTYIQRNRRFVWNYLLAHPCVDCGFSNPKALDFDHIKGQKKDNISNMIYNSTSVATIQQEINKCEVRCRNCHAIKTANQFGYYQWVDGDIV